jgi:hypothetical protein
MRAYIITTGIIFALITVAHLVRVATESTRFLTDPSFMLLTILSAALTIWSFVVLRRLRR